MRSSVNPFSVSFSGRSMLAERLYQSMVASLVKCIFVLLASPRVAKKARIIQGILCGVGALAGAFITMQCCHVLGGNLFLKQAGVHKMSEQR